MKRLVIAAFGIMSLFGPAEAFAAAQTSDAGLPGGYLKYSGGPEALGMGRAFVGLAEGADAVTFNPAGLGYLRPNTVGFMHTQTPEDARLENFSYAQPIYRFGGIGLNYTRMDSGSLQQTDQYNRQVGNFNDLQQTVMLGYGYHPLDMFSVGGTFKYASQSLAGASANGWGMDLGFLAKLPYNLGWGLNIENLVPVKLGYATGSDQFPRTVVTGLAAKLFQDKAAVTLDAEKSISVPGSVQIRTGMQWTLWHVAALRAGFDVTTREFSFGLGYLWGRNSIDYASSTSEFGNSQRVGLAYSWGGYPVSINANPPVFSPVGLTKRTTMEIQVDHNKRINSWLLQIRNQSRDVVRSMRGSGNPPSELIWDGTTEMGMMVGAGNYTYTLTLTDIDGQTETTPVQTIRVEYGTPLDTLELRQR